MKTTFRRKLRAISADMRVWFRYRTFKPDAVYLPGCSNLLSIDPEDQRAYRLLVRDVARGKITRSAKLWRCFNSHLNPQVLVDVGLNYGECLFGATYAPDAQLFGFEANPKVFAYGCRSRDNHPSKDRITLTNALISDRLGPPQDLFVDPSFSGTASAIGGIHSSRDFIKYTVPVSTIDQVIPAETAKGKRLLFKMDIEGYEQKALHGFQRTINEASEAVGLMEFDTRFLTLGGTDPEAFLAELKTTFHVFFAINKKARVLREAHIKDFPEGRFHPGERHTDLILIKRTPKWQACVPKSISILDYL